MIKSAAEVAAIEQILTRVDRLATHIQKNHEAWGMPFEAARDIVNALDKTADEVELTAFGKESFEKRRAEVIQKESDEPYMSAFANPMAPIQTESDEPYMKAYKDDQSSAVVHGKSTTGRPLAPGH